MSTSKESPYTEMVRRIHIVCVEKTDKALAVFLANRKSDNQEVWLLGIINNLTEDRQITAESSFSILAEFMPDTPIDQIYLLKEFYVADVTKKSELPPVPDNMIRFDKNRKKK